jgi:hypothetical protein
MAPPLRFSELRDETWLREQIRQGHNTMTLSRELGCSDPLVGAAFKRFGLKPRRGTSPAGPARLVERLLEQGLDPDATATAVRLALLLDEKPARDDLTAA